MSSMREAGWISTRMSAMTCFWLQCGDKATHRSRNRDHGPLLFDFKQQGCAGLSLNRGGVGFATARVNFGDMETRGVAEAALLGAAAGMRTFMPLAALGLGLPRRRRELTGAPLALASAFELVYDKLAQAGERTAPPQLAVRLGAGTIAGAIAGRVVGGSVTLGAATGGLAALASTFMCHRLRAVASRRVPPAAAVAEDALAIASATAAVRLLRRER